MVSICVAISFVWYGMEVSVLVKAQNSNVAMASLEKQHGVEGRCPAHRFLCEAADGSDGFLHAAALQIVSGASVQQESGDQHIFMQTQFAFGQHRKREAETLSASANTCQGGWPLFNDVSQLLASPWARYIKAVYGEIPRNDYPICIGDFWVFYNAELEAAGVTLPESNLGCPPSGKKPGHYTRNTKWGASWMSTHIYHFAPHQPLSANTWAEVCHRARTWESMFERHGAWFSYCKGSGIWVNIGRTRYFDTHRDAFNHFQVATENDMARAASSQGFDTIQFMRGDGVSTSACCAQLQLGPCCDNLAFEFVAVKLRGTYGCAEPPETAGHAIRAGWKASRPCNCKEGASKEMSQLNTYVSHINCEGVPSKTKG